MRNIIFKFMSLVALSLLLYGCDISRTPRHQIDSSKSFTSLDDARNWDRGFMATFRGNQGGIFEIVQDIQADQLNRAAGEGNHYPGSVNWNLLTTGDYRRQDVYIYCYQAISNLNTILAQVPNVQMIEEDKPEWDRIIGRIYFLRAYYYSQLAVRYGTPYKSASASSDLCVPIYLVHEPLARPERGTNEEVYNLIFSDLKEAKTRLVNFKGKPMSAEITIDAITALEARTRLYMSDWNAALDAAETLIASNTYPLVEPLADNFKKMWVNDQSSEEILQLYVARPDETKQINNYFGASTDQVRKDGTKGVNTPGFLPTQWMIDLYEDNDLRKDVYFELQETNLKDRVYDLYVIAKRKGNPALAATTNPVFTWWNGYVPNGNHRPKVFRIAEQYLIASEAAYNIGDEAKAKRYLNDLRESRGLDPVTASGSELFQEIKDERTRELAYEGFRLWDLRRWGEPVKRHSPQVVEGVDFSVYLADKSYEFEYKAGDYRMVWPIPANDINTNPNIANQQNPGW